MHQLLLWLWNKCAAVLRWILHAREIPSGRIILSLCGWILLHNNIWIKTPGCWPSRVFLFCSRIQSARSRGKLASCEFFTTLETCLQQSELSILIERKMEIWMYKKFGRRFFTLWLYHMASDHFYINIVWERSNTNLHSNQNWILKSAFSADFYELIASAQNAIAKNGQKIVSSNAGNTFELLFCNSGVPINFNNHLRNLNFFLSFPILFPLKYFL